MNPNLDRLQDYPFQRMAALKAGVQGNPDFDHIALSIGEPQHAPPDFVLNMLANAEQLKQDLTAYPATRGESFLREAIAEWIQRRYTATADPERREPRRLSRTRDSKVVRKLCQHVDNR